MLEEDGQLRETTRGTAPHRRCVSWQRKKEIAGSPFVPALPMCPPLRSVVVRGKLVDCDQTCDVDVASHVIGTRNFAKSNASLRFLNYLYPELFSLICIIIITPLN